MTDDIDRACEDEEWFRSQSLDNRDVAASILPFTGECYNCESPIEIGSFCNTDCRDDYDLREKQNKQRV